MSLTVLNAIYTAENILIALLLIAAVIVLIVKRRMLAAAGMGVLVLGQLVNVAWAPVVGALGSDRDTFVLASLGFTTAGNLLFVLGLGLILAEIFVKRPADRLQGHP